MFDSYFTQKLKDDEKLVLQAKKHIASFIIPILKTCVIVIIPFFLIFFLFSSVLGVIIFFLWVAAGLGYGVFQWLTWYFDSIIITDKRIICLDQKSLFNRVVSEVGIASVQDVTYEVNGFFASAFNFGILRISSAPKVLEIKGVPNPKSLQELIFDLRQKTKKTLSAQELVEMLEKSE
jgi:hypothetical protein